MALQIQSMKTIVHITLLSLWICAQTVPSLVSLFSTSENPVIVMNFNEEEQQEQGKTDTEEKQMICSISIPNYLAMDIDSEDDYIHYLLRALDHDQEITLPPPEL